MIGGGIKKICLACCSGARPGPLWLDPVLASAAAILLASAVVTPNRAAAQKASPPLPVPCVPACKSPSGVDLPAVATPQPVTIDTSHSQFVNVTVQQGNNAIL